MPEMISKPREQWSALVQDLQRREMLRTPTIIRAFSETPRSHFVPDEWKQDADRVDAALPIGEGQTISQPMTVAIMLELLQPRVAEHVLDIGTGSGWQAALLARIVGPQGNVSTIERLPRLAERARAFLQNEGLHQVTSYVGDAARGLPSKAPFDIIVAAAESFDVPPALLEQLAPGGRLLQPISGMGLRLVTKAADQTVTTKDIPGFVFVPFVETGEEPKTV